MTLDPADMPSSTAAMRYYVGAAILLCLMTVLAVVLITVFAPDNMTAVSVLVGITTPVTMALLAAGLQGMAGTIDGKMTQLLDETAQKERLKGLLTGLRENPGVNLDPHVPPDTGERRGTPPAKP